MWGTLRRVVVRTLIVVLVLLGCAMLVLWVRGQRVSDTIWYDYGRYGGALMSHRGQLALSGSFRGRTDASRPLVFEYHPWQTAKDVDPYWPFTYAGVDRHAFAGFAVSIPTPAAAQPGYWCVELPMWFLALAAIGCGVLLWRRDRRRAGAAARGQCRVCGYDLRATPDRCPECGTPAPAGEAGSAAAVAFLGPRP